MAAGDDLEVAVAFTSSLINDYTKKGYRASISPLLMETSSCMYPIADGAEKRIKRKRLIKD